mgnify:CR=1 FL=1
MTWRRPTRRLSARLSLRAAGAAAARSCLAHEGSLPRRRARWRRSQPGPALASSNPAIHRPDRARQVELQRLSATAFAIRSRGTRLVITAW